MSSVFDYGVDQTLEQEAAAAVASLSTLRCKRELEAGNDNGIADDERCQERPSKRRTPSGRAEINSDTTMTEKSPALQESPFFYYRDHSADVDDDPLTPLTPPGRVPSFPAKLHAILARPDLSDIVAWMPHGRSWRVLKPREFEIRVISTYFEHAKFSSFIRQANGWGFRRITQGRDRNSYYHELFLRNLPHLCKKMKRPGVAEKTTADPDHEPDLYKISEIHPIPSSPCEDENIMLPCTLKEGPKARMPVHYGAMPSIKGTSQQQMPPTQNMQQHTQTPAPTAESAVSPFAAAAAATTAAATVVDPTKFGMNPRDFVSLTSFQHALQASYHQISLQRPQDIPPPTNLTTPPPDLSSIVPGQSPLYAASLSATRQAAAVHQAAMSFSLPTVPPANILPAPPSDPYAASQYAAGFAAATAISSNRIRSVLENALAVSGQTVPSASPTTLIIPTLYQPAPQQP